MSETSAELDAAIRAAIDQEHLRLLRIFHFVQGAFATVIALAALAYAGMFLTIFSTVGQMNPRGQPPPKPMIFFFVGMMGFMFLFAATTATLNFLAARWLRTREHRIVVMVISGLNCLFMPQGTLLGIFTLFTLSRPSVRALFEPPQP